MKYQFLQNIILEEGGIYEERSIFSEGLQENRKVSVYLPPGYNRQEKYPLLVMTDGQHLSSFYKVIDSLIQNALLKKIVVIGVHSGVSKMPDQPYSPDGDIRSREYLVGFSKYTSDTLGTRYQDHLKFFLKELGPWIKKNYSIREDKPGKFLFGSS